MKFYKYNIILMLKISHIHIYTEKIPKAVQSLCEQWAKHTGADLTLYSGGLLPIPSNSAAI